MINNIISSHYILKLECVSRQNRAQVGVKAANLGELAKAGFLVPKGFVLTIDAFQAFLAKNALTPDATFEQVTNGIFPEDVFQALKAELSSYNDAALVARSSGVAEDLADASFAGQYATVLDIRGVEALVNAVRTCWASAFDKRLASYRQSHRLNGISPMAVLVQHLVAADAAGVAFTANPVTGDREEVIVNAVRCSGERLVSGRVSPDEWVVKQARHSAEIHPKVR